MGICIQKSAYIHKKRGDFLKCSINDLKNKEVINITDGARLGFVTDAEFDLSEGKILSLLIEGPYRIMGLFGKSSDIVIKWENIKKIGSDFIFIESVL